MKLNFEELPQATAFLLEKVEELTISINEMKQLLKRQTAAKEEMIGGEHSKQCSSQIVGTIRSILSLICLPVYLFTDLFFCHSKQNIIFYSF